MDVIKGQIESDLAIREFERMSLADIDEYLESQKLYYSLGARKYFERQYTLFGFEHE